MATTFKWTGWTSRGDVLTTQLNALANGSRTAAGAAVDNATNLDTYGTLELHVTFGSAPSAGGHVNVHMLTAPDGSTYDDGSATVDPGGHTLVVAVPVRASTAAQILMSEVFSMKPAPTKFILENQAGQAFPASGSTVELFTANLQGV